MIGFDFVLVLRGMNPVVTSRLPFLLREGNIDALLVLSACDTLSWCNESIVPNCPLEDWGILLIAQQTKQFVAIG